MTLTVIGLKGIWRMVTMPCGETNCWQVGKYWSQTAVGLLKLSQLSNGIFDSIAFSCYETGALAVLTYLPREHVYQHIVAWKPAQDFNMFIHQLSYKNMLNGIMRQII